MGYPCVSPYILFYMHGPAISGYLPTCILRHLINYSRQNVFCGCLGSSQHYTMLGLLGPVEAVVHTFYIIIKRYDSLLIILKIANVK